MSLPSGMANFVPCDRLLQKAYWESLFSIIFCLSERQNSRLGARHKDKTRHAYYVFPLWRQLYEHV